jgi:soluble lytic murein transglycosylase
MRVIFIIITLLFFWGFVHISPSYARAGVSEALLEWRALQNEGNAVSFSRYKDFLMRYPNWPLARKIRTMAERIMPENLPPREILAFYDGAAPITGKGMRAYMSALHQIGRDQSAAAAIRSWYSDAYLGTDDQENFLHEYKKSLFPFSARSRIDYLMDTDQDEKALDLARLLGDTDVHAISLWRKIRSVSGREDLSRFPPNLLGKEWRSNPGIWADVMRVYRLHGSTEMWLDLFQKAPQKIADQKGSRPFANEHQALVYRLLDQNRFADAYRVAGAVTYDDADKQEQFLWLQGYVAFDHLHQPGRAFQHFETLYKQSKSIYTRSRAGYYAGLSSDALGYPDVAQAWYKMAARFSYVYYGQLAQEKITIKTGDAVGVKDDFVPIVTAQERDLFNQNTRVQAAQILVHQGRRDDAVLFLRALSDDITGGQKEGAGREQIHIQLVFDLAGRLKIYPEIVRLNRQAAKEGIDFGASGYPVPSFIRAAPDVDLSVVLAIIRQESAFDPGAISPSGARGLMQLMPGTAADVAKRQDISHHVDWLTDRPSHNLELGRAYMGSLLKRFKGSVALAAAAYNAGPRRVDEWLLAYGDPRTGAISERAFVERIPYTETRLYVQRVMEGMIAYRHRLGFQKSASLSF